MAQPLTAAMIGLTKSHREVFRWTPAGFRSGLQIVACRKRAFTRTGDDDDPHIRVFSDLIVNLAQLLMTRRMQRIHQLRSVQRDVADAVLLLVFDKLVCHLCSSPFSILILRSSLMPRA
jgi:hypothetical protein